MSDTLPPKWIYTLDDIRRRVKENAAWYNQPMQPDYVVVRDREVLLAEVDRLTELVDDGTPVSAMSVSSGSTTPLPFLVPSTGIWGYKFSKDGRVMAWVDCSAASDP